MFRGGAGGATGPRHGGGRWQVARRSACAAGAPRHRAGVAARRSISEHCTRCGDSPFYSHRGGCAERQIAVMAVRGRVTALYAGLCDSCGMRGRSGAGAGRRSGCAPPASIPGFRGIRACRCCAAPATEPGQPARLLMTSQRPDPRNPDTEERLMTEPLYTHAPRPKVEGLHRRARARGRHHRRLRRPRRDQGALPPRQPAEEPAAARRLHRGRYRRLNAGNPQWRAGGARDQTGPGRHRADVPGTNEVVDGIVTLTRIDIHYQLRIPAGSRGDRGACAVAAP
jgi:hypothetical protein